MVLENLEIFEKPTGPFVVSNSTTGRGFNINGMFYGVPNDPEFYRECARSHRKYIKDALVAIAKAEAMVEYLEAGRHKFIFPTKFAAVVSGISTAKYNTGETVAFVRLGDDQYPWHIAGKAGYYGDKFVLGQHTNLKILSEGVDLP